MKFAAALLFTSAIVAAGQSPAPGPAVPVTFETSLGRFTIAVDVAHAPATSANFLKYVDGGFYNGGEFHRTVRPSTESRTDFPIQVIQARIDQVRRRDGFPAIALERTSVTGLKHLDGTVSMARSGVDSATSDFFVCIGPQPELDYGGRRNADGQGFAAFGQVTSGMDVIRKIQAADVAAGTQTLTPTIKIVRAARTGG